VCNVGDCRVILGQRNSDGHTRSYTSFDNEEEKEEEKCEIEEYTGYSQTHVEEQRYRPEGEVLAITLTKDHTLFCQEELERIKKAGAEVEPINQIEDTDLAFNSLNGMGSGEREENPLLLQITGKPHTCTKFTRSIGDSMIEGIGVSSEPAVLSCDLSTNDDMLIIASNGVFEFLTNQEVIDICSASRNPLQASEDVTKAAYNKSIEHKNHCTDLTIIVCFLSSAYQPQNPEDIAVSTDSLAMMDICK
ncbi:MAG: serine/threonine protein phosphatase PrpC, partial [Bacillariaceae sp.]|jgi:serine/threonine protein phosphatase PrpC